MKETFLQIGSTFEAPLNSKKGFSLTGWLRKLLVKWNFPFFDECCPTASPSQPVRGLDTENLEVLINGVWTPYTPTGSGGPTIHYIHSDGATSGTTVFNNTVPVAGDYWIFSTRGDGTDKVDPIFLTGNSLITDVVTWDGISYSTYGNEMNETTNNTASGIFLVVPNMKFSVSTYTNFPQLFHLQQIGIFTLRPN